MSKQYVVVKREPVCDTIESFYFRPEDGSKVKKATAGQFLPIKIKLDSGEEVFRTYSVSNAPNEEMYRISVKKIEGGLVSSYLHDKVKEGDKIEINDPCGVFVIENAPKDEHITFLAGGIGITPLLCMLHDEKDKRDGISFIQAMQNSSMNPFQDEIKNICKEKDFKNTVFFSNPLDTDKKGENYDEDGFVTKEFLEKHTDLTGSYYFCGPPIFMEIMEKNLLELGVKQEKIHYEKFS